MKYIKVTGKKGHPAYLYNGKYIYSSYDPFIEAKRFLETFQNLKQKVITCCGADFINKELIERGIENIISIEPFEFERLINSDKIKITPL